MNRLASSAPHFLAASMLSLTSLLWANAAVACPTGVRAHSNPPNIIHNPRLHSIYWGDYWNYATTQRNNIDATWSDLGSSTVFWGRLAEYGVGTGSYSGSSLFNPGIVQGGAGSYVAEDTMRIELQNEIEGGLVPNFGDNNDLYVIYLPPGVANIYDDDHGALAHHNSWVDGAGRLVRYAIIEFSNTDNQTDYASHEIIEAATDPDPDLNSGYWTDNGGLEIGDLCQPDMYRQDGHLIQGAWSEDACACIEQPLPPPVDPCAHVPPADRLCCKKPWLPVCNGNN